MIDTKTHNHLMFNKNLIDHWNNLKEKISVCNIE